jgi:hypothetical protein
VTEIRSRISISIVDPVGGSIEMEFSAVLAARGGDFLVALHNGFRFHVLTAGALMGALGTGCGTSTVPATTPGSDGGSGSGSGSSSGLSGSSSGGSSGGAAGSSGSSGASSGASSGSSSSSSSGAALDSGTSGSDGSSRPIDAGWGTAVDGGPGYSGPTVSGTVTVARGAATGHLGPGFAGFSFEKTHITDGFFTASNAPLIALFQLLGPGIMRIGANDVDNTTWQPAAMPVPGGTTSPNVGTADVDALAAFLSAAGWKVIYGVNMKTSTAAAAAAEATYVSNQLGANLSAFEIGNEINYYAGAYATVTRPKWESFADAIHAAVPNAPLAGPAALAAASYSATFATDEASRIVLLTHHYYRGSATGGNATLANLLALDPAVVSDSQALSTAASSNGIRDGFRWGEMNSYSSHGAAGVSDVLGSALWSIDFMLTTARYGSQGVNFHGGGQNMDNNPCDAGPTSCTRPFRYSPIDEVNSQVTAAAPLFYGMLFVSRAGVGDVLSATASAGSLNFSAYAIAQSDGSTNVALVNKDAASGVNASVDVGMAVTTASALYLQGSSLSATTGVTLAGASVAADGTWNPNPPYALSTQGNVVTVLVPPASAALVHAR